MTKVIARGTGQDGSAIGLNVRLQRAMAHPLRVQIMQQFDGDPPEGKKAIEWAPAEVARELDAELGNVSYHMRVLTKLGFIRVHRKSHARGAVVHYYRKRAKSGWEGLEGEYGMPLAALRDLVTSVEGYAPSAKVGLLVDGDELVIGVGKVRRRVFPDGTVCDETNGSNGGGGDGDE